MSNMFGCAAGTWTVEVFADEFPSSNTFTSIGFVTNFRTRGNRTWQTAFSRNRVVVTLSGGQLLFENSGNPDQGALAFGGDESCGKDETDKTWPGWKPYACGISLAAPRYAETRSL